MATSSKRGSFSSEQDAIDARAVLSSLVLDRAYNTSASYSADSTTYPDNIIPFIEKHMNYMRTHSVEPNHYLSNLRLMIRIR